MRNPTTDAAARYPGMRAVLPDIVQAGGTTGFLRSWRAMHPELGIASP